MPAAGVPVVVGFSGGPDSTALLAGLAAQGSWPLVVVHVDHGMRPDSAEAAASAGRLAREVAERAGGHIQGTAIGKDRQGLLGPEERARRPQRVASGHRITQISIGISFHVITLEPRAKNETDARERRHAALANAARRASADAAIALGHTADDQVETLLLRLARGTGNRGLGGMAAWEPGPAGAMIARPLLHLTRADIDAYLAEQGISALEDPTNQDPAYADRNRVRHEAVPALRALNPRVAEAAGRLAQLAREDDEALTAWAGTFIGLGLGAPASRRPHEAGETAAAGPTRERLQSNRPPDRHSVGPSLEGQQTPDDRQGGRVRALPEPWQSISVSVKAFNALPVAVRRRVVRVAAPEARFDQVEQVIGLAAGRPPGHTHLAGDVIAERSGVALVFRSAEAPRGAKCRICLTPPPLLPSMEREFGNLGTAPNGPDLDPTGLD
ncbi:MAG: tRNA lysidine(34) synthetase TilS [Candidatus Sericytochromatia bacterium]|uniref:tRNA(Ile)-lysidine synthase n=1 Tax=Candidatus Tanganyikabacteria bacterium TaxID=2961651 RepID=A0A937X080_9BACT|nr:tRNA lysidine(34) synthetase TilS [Candidatus Tanganyikabacteria bacterium]